MDCARDPNESAPTWTRFGVIEIGAGDDVEYIVIGEATKWMRPRRGRGEAARACARGAAPRPRDPALRSQRERAPVGALRSERDRIW